MLCCKESVDGRAIGRSGRPSVMLFVVNTGRGVQRKCGTSIPFWYRNHVQGVHMEGVDGSKSKILKWMFCNSAEGCGFTQGLVRQVAL
jgi:hypothetical protein